MSTYELGTVAVATVRGVPNVRVIRRATGWASAVEIDGRRMFHPDRIAAVTDIRPLVVLDPEDTERVQRLVRAFWDAQRVDDGDGSDLAYMAEALRSLNHPPKPAEPKGLGAVVEDASGEKWIRCTARLDYAWQIAGAVGSPWVRYAAIDAVRVLSEGVQS